MSTEATFQAERPRLLSIAYRMLGSAAEAEDVLQDAWMRWSSARPATLESPAAWLTTVVARLSLDRLERAKHEREKYTGTWLPEPVLTGPEVDPSEISFAFLLLLERLTPLERAVYVLRELFDHQYGELSELLGKSEVSLRQVHHRACTKIDEATPARYAPTSEAHLALVQAFAKAVQQGDFDGLRGLLAEQATLVGDGGGKAPALKAPLEGAEAIARFFLKLAQLPTFSERQLSIEPVNGLPALVIRNGPRAEVVVNFECEGDRVVAIRNVINPDKLAMRRLS